MMLNLRSLSAFFFVAGMVFPANVALARADFAPGELLVKFKESASSSARARVASLPGVTPVREVAEGGLMHLKLPKGTDLESTIKAMQDDPQVEFVQPNYRYHATRVPNDPKYPSQWALKNTGQSIANDPSAGGAGFVMSPTTGIAGKDLHLESAWNLITDCSSTIVAVIDSGVNYAHPELSANMWPGGYLHGWDFVEGDNSSPGNGPMDTNGHGTHVAGTIAAAGNNAMGTAGICWSAQIMALRALDSDGTGLTSDIVEAVDYARTHGAKVINMSLAGGTFDPALSTAITNASNAGIAIIVAAGNEGNDNDAASSVYPCNYGANNLLCVAALDQSYQLASFSNYGAQSVDVGAPGVNILSTYPKITEATYLSESFNTSGVLNWTVAGSGSSVWGYGARSLSPSGSVNLGTFDMLMMPGNWDGIDTVYDANVDRRIYKNFNLASITDSVMMMFKAYLDTESGYDPFEVYMKPSGGDPNSGGILLDQMTGASQDPDLGDVFRYDVSRCRTATCTLGFRFESDFTGEGTGVGIYSFHLNTVSVDRTTGVYTVEAGTSMASPHVAGIAALVLSYNPLFTGSDVIQAIRNGGIAVSSLNGKTTTGKAADAFGALTYLSPPASVSGAVQ